MFTRNDLDRLLAYEQHPAVSLFLPTHVAGREIRQDPVRLRNLLDKAAGQLARAGMRGTDAERLLQPGRDLVADDRYWREQEQGLAVFIGHRFFEAMKLPIAVAETAVVGPRFHLRPLLPALADDRNFMVLTISARRAHLFHADRYAMTELKEAALPYGVEAVASMTDYQDTRHAAPAGRPASPSGGVVGAAHSFGDDPESLRKTQLLEYIRRVATGLDTYGGDHKPPIVLAAQPEIQGHFRTMAKLQNLVEQPLDENPDALDRADLHRRAYAIVEPLFGQERKAANDQFNMLLGNGSERATMSVEEIVKAARYGRVDTLFLAQEEHVWGRFDEAADRVIAHDAPAEGDEDLLDYAATNTLLKGGNVNVVARDQMPRSGAVAAIFRY
jgi:hypothetical protein